LLKGFTAIAARYAIASRSCCFMICVTADRAFATEYRAAINADADHRDTHSDTTNPAKIAIERTTTAVGGKMK